MKKLLFILLLSFTATGVFAQTHKLTIYSTFGINGTNVIYTDYDKLYPDSIKNAVMIDYKKKYKLINKSTLLLRMNQDGWKLVATTSDVSGFNGNVSSSVIYLMSKEILLDDAAMNLYLQNLEKLR